MSNRTRAYRRHHRARMIQRAMNSQVVRWWYPSKDKNIAAIRLHNHLAVCSCYACGNPRHSAWEKMERLTMQERKTYNAVSEGLEDYYDIL